MILTGLRPDLFLSQQPFEKLVLFWIGVGMSFCAVVPAAKTRNNLFRTRTVRIPSAAQLVANLMTPDVTTNSQRKNENSIRNRSAGLEPRSFAHPCSERQRKEELEVRS